MIFSEQELICFNSILDGKNIIGIEFSNEKIKDESKYIEQTIEKLKRKNIIDKAGKLTKIGVLPILALEEYKKAKEHIRINTLNIGVLEDNNFIVIDTMKDDYNIYMSSKIEIIKEILKKSDFIRAESSNECEFQKESVPFSKLISDDFDKKSILISKYRNGRKIYEKIYYWNEKEGFEYDLKKEIRIQLSPRKMRTSLLKDMDMF